MRLLLVLALSVVLPAAASAQAPGSLIGRVLSADADRPLTGVSVALIDTVVMTDGRGMFTIAPVRAGTHAIRFEMPGYQLRVDTVTITAGHTNEISVTLSQQPVQLPPLLVTVRSPRLEASGFYDRRFHSGLSGRFMDRAAIERSNATNITDLFRDVSGARQVNGFSRRLIQFAREASRGTQPALLPARQLPDAFENWLVRLPGCQPAVYIDGRPHYDRMISGYGNYVDDFNVLSPMVIEGLEVYVGASTPTEFRSNNGCGVVLIWTRRR